MVTMAEEIKTIKRECGLDGVPWGQQGIKIVERWIKRLMERGQGKLGESCACWVLWVEIDNKWRHNDVFSVEPLPNVQMKINGLSFRRFLFVLFRSDFVRWTPMTPTTSHLLNYHFSRYSTRLLEFWHKPTENYHFHNSFAQIDLGDNNSAFKTSSMVPQGAPSPFLSSYPALTANYSQSNSFPLYLIHSLSN